MDICWAHFVDHIVQLGEFAAFPAQCDVGYMEWFYRISHPFMIPPEDRDPPRHPPVLHSARLAHGLAPDVVHVPAPSPAHVPPLVDSEVPQHAVI